jgi:crotonobetainyl-CoA:carnitine CoA-transferase CaiB-like acyl-CoA transferase
VAGPLEGLLVVDTSWGMPGAVTGLLLADYGARVVKLERPGGGPDVGTVTRKAWDRGKWSVTCDPRTTAGVDHVRSLLGDADVYLESFGAGRAPDGLHAAQLESDFPSLVHCSITGYGRDGPLRDRPGYDALVAARFGLMVEQPGHRDGPIFLGHPVIGYSTAFLSTIGVLAALRARRHTGRGQLVDASLLDGMLAVMSMNWWWNEKGLSYLAREGTETGFGRNRIITDLFLCGDGEYLMMHTGGDGGFKRTMDILGLGDHVRAIEGLEMSVPLDDDEYHAARHLAPDAFRGRSRAEWLARFHEADIAALPVLHPHEALDDEQVRFAGVVIDQPDPDVGTIRQVGPVTIFADSPAGRAEPAPAVGQHDGRPIAAGRRAAPAGPAAGGSRPAPVRHALDGVRILDFSAFFATAYGARLLSDLGADVIKVEPLGGDQMRPLADLFEGAQRGKRNLAVDLRSGEGREVVARLVATADVVMHNFRPGKAEKIGLGYEDLRLIRPDLIYAYLPGFGSHGPKSELKSFAPLVSGFAGLLYEAAGAGNPPVRRAIGNEDLYNGFAGAVAVLLALEHRGATGRGQYVENPQLHSSLFVVTDQCADGEGRPLPGLQLDADQTGWGPLYRLYRTSDGWICIACVGDRAWRRLATALGRDDLGDDPRYRSTAARADHASELVELLAGRFGSWTTEDARAALDAAGVASEVPLDHPLLPDFLWDEWAAETGRVVEHHHPEHGWVREVGLVVRLSDTPGAFRGPSPRLGEHTEAILGELGYAPDEIARLTAGPCLAAPVGVGE